MPGSSGNMGDLWFSLGVKENVSKDLNKILKMVQESDGSVSRLRKSLREYIAQLDEADKKEFGKSLKKGVSNALDYLSMLQKIEQETRKIQSLKSLNNGVNTSMLDKAEAMLRKIKTDLLDLQKGKTFGGVDASDLMAYSKTLKNTISDVRALEKSFNKENSISNASSNAARLNNELGRIKNRLAEIYSAQSTGMKGGFSTGMLLGAGHSLRGVKRRAENMLSSDELLSNETKYKQLISDIAFAFTKATGKMQEYAREKEKTAQANKEAERTSNQIENERARPQKQYLADLNREGMVVQRTAQLKEQAESQEYERKRRQAAQQKSQQDAEFKALDAYAIRYQKLAEARRVAAEAMANKTSDFTAMQNEAREAQVLSQRLGELSRLKADIQERDRQATEHGAFTAMQNEAREAQVLSQREQELSRLKEAITRRSDEQAAAEKRLAEAIARTNQARRESIAGSRSTAQSLVGTRVNELEAQRAQLQSLYANGRNFLSADELTQIRTAFAQITQEINSLRAAMNNLGSYSIKELFSMARGTSNYAPLVGSMDNVLRQKQEAVNLELKHQQEVNATAARVRSDLTRALSGANDEAKRMSSTLSDIKSLFLQGGVVFGAQQFFNSIVQTGGEIVQQHVALRSILGNVQKADELFAQTQQLALQSPFKFGELNRDVKQLAAFGVEANDLFDTAKRLADIASGLGVSFERLGLAYGQVKARSWLDGKELRQFAYAGLPLLQKIAELYNATGKNGRNDYKAGDIKKMITNREVSFEDVQKVLWQMTDAGGQFYNMQFVLSETLLGRWNKLIDAWDIMLGKFAEGKNVVGGTFSRLIDLATNFVLALDKISPAMLALGGMFALKKVSGAIGSKVGITSNIAAMRTEQQMQLRTYAAKQQQLFIEGKITQEKLRQNIANYQGFLNSKLTMRNTFEQAAIEGKLSLLKMQKAVREKLIAPELIKQLQLMGLISQKESELILKEGARARVSLGARQMLGGFFSSGWNVATLGVTVGMALWSAYSSFRDKIKQDTDNINANAKSTYESINSVLSEVGEKGSGASLQEQVDKMTDVLKQSNLYTDSIKEQIASTNDLGKEYDILKGKIEEARNANNFSVGEAGAYAKAKAATGAGFAGGSSWFGQWTGIGQDDIDANTDDVAASLASLQMKLEKFSNSTKQEMEKVANSYLGAKAAGMSFEEKIAELYLQRVNNGYWEYLVQSVSKGRKDISQDIRGLEDDLGDFGYNFKEITTDDIPKYINEMAKSRNMSLNEFSDWCQKHPEKFKSMLDQMLAEADKKVPNLVARLQQVAKAILHIGTTTPQNNGKSKPAVWKNPLKEGTIDRKAYNKLHDAGKLNGGKNGFYQKEMAELIYQINNGQSKGWEDFGEAVRKQYKTVRNENNAAAAAGENKPYERKQQMLEAIANQLGIDLDVGKNKVTGDFGKDGKNNKYDKELKAWQERLSSYKSARQSYQKYKTVMGEAAAKEYIESLYDNIDGLDLENYEQGIKKLESELDFSKSPERKKALTDLKRELADWNFSETLKPQWERIAQDFQEALEDGVKRFDLYKSLLEKTGNKEFSMQAFGDGELWDDVAYNMAEKFREVTGGMEPDTTATDATAKHYLVDVLGNQQAYDEWKKMSDYVKNGYNEALKEAADILEETLNYEEQKVKLENEYTEAVKKANAVGGEAGDAIKRSADRKRDKGIASVNLRQIENSDTYLQFFTHSIQQSKQTLAKYAAFLKSELSKALEKGAITAEEYSKKIEDINNRMNGLNDYQFAGGGLSGMASSQRKRGERQVESGQRTYDSAKQAYDMAKTADEITSAQEGMKAGQSMMDGGSQLMQGADQMAGTISMIDTIIHGINDLVQGLNDTFQDIKETAEALGADTDSDEWTDANSFFSGFSSASASATKGWDSLKNGDMGGVVSGVVGSFTGWIKAFSAGHDQKLDNQIKIAERQEQLLKTIADNINTVIENTLGGIYNYQATDYARTNLEKVKSDYETRSTLEAQLNGTGSSMKYLDPASGGALGILTSGISNLFTNKKSKLKKKINKITDYSDETYEQTQKALSSGTAYDAQLATLMAQRDTLQQQRNAEAAKKKSDQSKINDYDSQIEEMRLKIQAFAQDFLKSIYSIDMKSWASELTDAVVSAWSAGEDAVDAYKEKVKGLVKDLTKNILSQKIMEKAMEEPLNYLTGLLEEKGQLDEGDMEQLATKLYEAGESSVSNITGILDALKKKGLDLSDDSSSSTSNSIKSITEETADLLAAYLNAIRLDVSAIRGMEATKISDMGEIQKSQLEQLRSISQNTLRNAEAAERIEIAVSSLNDNFDRVLVGTKSIKVR